MNDALSAFIFFVGITWAAALSTVGRFRSFDTRWVTGFTLESFGPWLVSVIICNAIPILTIYLVVKLKGYFAPTLQGYEVIAAAIASLSSLSMSRLIHSALLILGPYFYGKDETAMLHKHLWSQDVKSELDEHGCLVKNPQPLVVHLVPGILYLIVPLVISALIIGLWGGRFHRSEGDKRPPEPPRQDRKADLEKTVEPNSERNFVDWSLAVAVASLVVAVVAVAYTIRESRVNNSPVVELLNCKASSTSSVYENNQELFHCFELTIKNKGLPLYAMHADIHFKNPRSGSVSIRIPPQEQHEGLPQCSKGMIAKFIIKSHLFKEQSGFLMLTDPIKQQAEIRIYSQGYLVWTFKAWTRIERFKNWWNRLALWLEMRFWWSEKREGDVDLLHTPVAIPKFTTVLWPIGNFFRSLQPRPTPVAAPALRNGNQ